MAVDKLVDSTQLDADLTTVANAIRTKGGTSANLSFPNGFAQAIADIPSGGESPWDFLQYAVGYANMFSYKRDHGFPQKLTITIPQGSGDFNCESMFSYCYFKADMKIIIENPNQRPLKVNNMFFVSQGATCDAITFKNGLVVANNGINNFAYAATIRNIYGEIDLSNVTAQWSNNTFSIPGLKTIRFKPNTISYNIVFTIYGVGATDSIISIANGLNESATDKTLSFNQTNKTQCSTIIGNVSMDETNTYHIFAADENGDTTLTDFITNTKGWTLA